MCLTISSDRFHLFEFHEIFNVEPVKVVGLFGWMLQSSLLKRRPRRRPRKRKFGIIVSFKIMCFV